jgi:hypothetical protein
VLCSFWDLSQTPFRNGGGGHSQRNEATTRSASWVWKHHKTNKEVIISPFAAKSIIQRRSFEWRRCGGRSTKCESRGEKNGVPFIPTVSWRIMFTLSNGNHERCETIVWTGILCFLKLQRQIDENGCITSTVQLFRLYSWTINKSSPCSVFLLPFHFRHKSNL